MGPWYSFLISSELRFCNQLTVSADFADVSDLTATLVTIQRDRISQTWIGSIALCQSSLASIVPKLMFEFEYFYLSKPLLIAVHKYTLCMLHTNLLPFEKFLLMLLQTVLSIFLSLFF